jgi:hypothetical protein
LAPGSTGFRLHDGQRKQSLKGRATREEWHVSCEYNGKSVRRIAGRNAIRITARLPHRGFFGAAEIAAEQRRLPCLLSRQPNGYAVGGRDAMPSSSTALPQDQAD